MTTIICNKPGCTLAETGKCILDNDPITCPDRLALIHEIIEPAGEKNPEPVTLNAENTEVDRFTGSYTLSNSEVRFLMNNRYCKLIGILGAPNSGKTACLASLYLMLAHGKFGKYEFRDSKTMMAFEEISRGARKWSVAGVPDQLTNHTQITDERSAGFLHLRLHSGNAYKFDILLPDLPGEWSSTLIDNNRIDRLSFLLGAEALWIFMSAEEISSDAKRNLTEHRLKLLMSRVTDLCNNSKPAISLILTHKDRFTVTEKNRKKMEEIADNFEFPFKIYEIASFSSNDAITPGDGIVELIDDLVDPEVTQVTHFWPFFKYDQNTNKRQILNYGKYWHHNEN